LAQTSIINKSAFDMLTPQSMLLIKSRMRPSTKICNVL